MRLRSRRSWGGAPLTGPKFNGVVGKVYIHHTAGVYKGTTKDSEKATMQALEAQHRNQGWNGVGYNYVIFPSGRVYVGRGHVIGAHNDGENSTSYGICFAGNFETQEPTKDALRACVSLIHKLQARGRLTRRPTIRGHRDSDATACPGKNLYAKVPHISLCVSR